MNKLINKFAILIFGIFSILVFNQAVSAQSRSEVWIIADQKADCVTVGALKCLQVKKPQDEKWTLLAQNIENFKYETGYTYVVRVKVDEVKNPPADASSLKYSLKKVLNRERTGGVIKLVNGEMITPNNSDLNGKNWQLTAINGEAVNTDKATIQFNFDKMSVGGKGGCNGFGGTLAKNGDEIKISQIISTKMFCENGSDVENKYLSALEKVNKYRISDSVLQLLNNEAVILEFAAKN